MKRRAVLAGLLALLLGGAAAPPPAWVVLREASTIELTVRALGGSHRGLFDDWRGDIVFDPAAPELTRATVLVQAASLRMRSSALTRRARSASLLDTARHPVVRFELGSLRPLGGGRHTARAEVTIKGRTRPVSFPVDLRVTGDRAHLAGAFTLDRTEFGIGTTGAWNRILGRQVTVRVSLQARRV